jgi:hypothetical protein
MMHFFSLMNLPTMHINLLIQFAVPYLVDDELRALTQVSKSYSRDISLVLIQVRDTGLRYENAHYVLDFRKNVEYVSKRLSILHKDAHDTFIMKAFAMACYNNDMRMAGWLDQNMYYMNPTYTDDTDLLGCSLDTGLYYATDEHRDNIRWIFFNLCAKQDVRLDTIKEFYHDYVRKYAMVKLDSVLRTVCRTSQRLDVATWLFSLLPEQFRDTDVEERGRIAMNNNTTVEFLDWYLPIFEPKEVRHRVLFAQLSLEELLKTKATKDKIVKMFTYLTNRYGTLMDDDSPSTNAFIAAIHHDVRVSAALPSIYESGYISRCQGWLSIFEHVSRHLQLFESDLRKWLAESTTNISNAFVQACCGGQLYALEWLLKNYGLGSFTDDTRLRGFCNASRCGHVHVLRWLDVKMAPFVRSRTVRRKALKQACIHGSFSTATYLCDAVNRDDESLFYETCARKHFHVAKLIAPRIQLSPSGHKYRMYDGPLTILSNMYHHSNHLFHVEWFKEKFEIDSDDVNALLAMVVSNSDN